jgi:hypothetical protein
VPDYTIDAAAADRIPLILFSCFQESWRVEFINEATLIGIGSDGID